MNHIAKLIILINKTQRIKPEIGQEQFSFNQDTGAKNATFMIRITSEGSIQKDVYMCFIDDAKAFDKAQHKNSLNYMRNICLYIKSSDR